MTKVVKEFILRDGIGAQLCRKLYTMSYAKHYDYLFEDTPIDDVMIHPLDNINNDEEKKKFINDFTSLINNPWRDIDFSNISDIEYCQEVGFLNKKHQGKLSRNTNKINFIRDVNQFSNLSHNIISNEIVFHIRRGNVLPHNPRWIDESVYVKMINSLEPLIEKIEIKNPKIIIVTDSSDKDRHYVNNNQHEYWQQPYLIDKEIPKIDRNQYEFKLSKIKEEMFENLKYDVTILKNLTTYESFIKMCRAKVLVTNESAFCRAATYLNKSYIMDWNHSAEENRLGNSLGWFDMKNKKVEFYEKR